MRARKSKTTQTEERFFRVFVEEAPVSIAMFDCDMRYLAASNLWHENFFPAEGDVIGRVHYEVIPDIPDRWKDNHRRALAGETLKEDKDPFPRADGRMQWISWELRPWRHADGEIGGIIMLSNDVTAWVEAEEAVRRSNAQLAAEANALSRLNEASSRLWQTQDLREGLGEMLSATIELLGAEKGAVQLWNDERNAILIAAQRGFKKEFLEAFREVSEDDNCACGRALRTGEIVVIEDVEEDEPYMAFLPVARAEGFRAVVAAPMINHSGVRLGVLSAHFRSPHRPSDLDLHRLKLYLHQAANFIERCTNENATRESEERFRALVTATSNMVASHMVYRMSPDWLEMRQLDGHGILSDTDRPNEAWPADYLYPEDQPRILEVIREAMRSKSIFDLEHRVRRADGTVGWVHSRAVPLLDAAGEIREWFGAAQDVTMRKRTEEALRESEERLRLAVDASRMAVWDWDMRTGKVTWNDEWHRMLGYRIGEIEPSFEAWISRIPPDERAAAEAKVATAMREHKEYINEHRILLPDGTTRWCAGRGKFFYDDAGKPTRMIGLSADVTEPRQHAERQGVLLAELQHRTRNLLAVVQSIAHRIVATAKSLADFENRFGQRLAALSRVQGLLSHADKEPVGVATLIAMELDALGSEALKHGITVTGPKVRVRSDVVQILSLAIHELATNALKYGALATENGRLSVTWKVAGAGVDRRLALEWVEHGIAAPRQGADPVRRGYGRSLIEQALPYALSAETNFELRAETLRCSIILPLTKRNGEEVIG